MHYVTIQPSKVDHIALGTMISVNEYLHFFRIASKQVVFLANSCLKENVFKDEFVCKFNRRCGQTIYPLIVI